MCFSFQLIVQCNHNTGGNLVLVLTQFEIGRVVGGLVLVLQHSIENLSISVIANCRNLQMLRNVNIHVILQACRYFIPFT